MTTNYGKHTAGGPVTSTTPFTWAIGGEPATGNAWLGHTVKITVTIDPGNDVHETNESNNVTVITVPVPSPLPFSPSGSDGDYTTRAPDTTTPEGLCRYGPRVLVGTTHTFTLTLAPIPETLLCHGGIRAKPPRRSCPTASVTGFHSGMIVRALPGGVRPDRRDRRPTGRLWVAGVPPDDTDTCALIPSRDDSSCRLPSGTHPCSWSQRCC